MRNKILQGDALTVLKTLPSESVDCVITSPPYWALRDYKVDGQIGNEKTIDEYITNLIQIFNECKRILKKTGTCWVVLGDTYSGSGGLSQPHRNSYGGFHNADGKRTQPSALAGGGFVRPSVNEVQDKSLCLIPERFALKMIEDESEDDYELNNDVPDWVQKELEELISKKQSYSFIKSCPIKTQTKQDNTIRSTN